LTVLRVGETLHSLRLEPGQGSGELALRKLESGDEAPSRGGWWLVVCVVGLIVGAIITFCRLRLSKF
jgi:hypothetical protein